MTYFISGHGDVTYEEFEQYYIPILNKAAYAGSDFVIGDFHGVDAMAQKWLCDNGFADKVTVYHMYGTPRRANTDIRITKYKGGFLDDESRDAAMTRDSDEDIAFVRIGKERSGTAQNIMRRHTMK